jgi:hypothetical protein
MKIVTIKFENTSEWKFLLELLKRLNFRFEWKEETTPITKKTKKPEDLVSELFGSFPSDKTSDELVQEISRTRKPSN